MDFTTTLSNELSKFADGKVYRYYKHNYYSFERISKLIDIVKEVDEISDLAVIPYHFFDGQILELYDYAMSIRVVNSVRRKELFFLEETGKKSIEEIDKTILEKLDMTYYEIETRDKEAFLSALTRYTNYMNSVQVKLLEELREELNLNDKTGLIFYQII